LADFSECVVVFLICRFARSYMDHEFHTGENTRSGILIRTYGLIVGIKAG